MLYKYVVLYFVYIGIQLYINIYVVNTILLTYKIRWCLSRYGDMPYHLPQWIETHTLQHRYELRKLRLPNNVSSMRIVADLPTGSVPILLRKHLSLYICMPRLSVPETYLSSPLESYLHIIYN